LRVVFSELIGELFTPALFFQQILSKSMDDSALPQDCVGCMAGLDFAVNGYMAVCDWAVPNVMISLSPARKTATVVPKDIAYLSLVFSHYKLICSCRSERKHIESVCPEHPFNDKISGAAKRTRSMSASIEPDSKTKPGMSSLVAIQTAASLSQVKLTKYSDI
jgi:hypothetical protein